MKRSMKFLGIVLISTTLINCKKIAEEETGNSIKGRLVSAVTTSVSLPAKPNVLLIVVDDLRYWSVKRLFEEAGMEPTDPDLKNGNRGNGKNMVPVTPNLDALIDDVDAVTFTNAHSSAVECCPSRTAFLFGKYPHQSGIYRNGNDWSTAITLTPGNTLTRQFVQSAKYKVFGAGKIFHINPDGQGKYFNPEGAGTASPNFKETSESIETNGYTTVQPTDDRAGYKFQIVKLNNPNDDFSLDTNVNVTQDAKAVTFCINKMQMVLNQNAGLAEADKSSFFVACGIRRPHSPLIVPENYFVGANAGVTPQVLPADITSLPGRAQYLINNNPPIAPDNLQNNGTVWNNYLRAYAGAVSYSDAQIGRLIKFIDANKNLHDNTIIVLISDHGFHLGDKHHVHKTTLYEETTRVPMIWRIPNQGAHPKYCRVPVDLMSIYPTLMDYCNMTYPSTEISGRDIRSLIESPATQPDPIPLGLDVALTVMDQKSSSVRSLNYRFIQYHDGGTTGQDAQKEEVYNHRGTAYSFDPWEARDLRSSNPPFVDSLRRKKNARIQIWKDMIGNVANE